MLLLMGEKTADTRPAAVNGTIADNSLQDLVNAEAVVAGTNGCSASEIDPSQLHSFSDRHHVKCMQPFSW